MDRPTSLSYLIGDTRCSVGFDCSLSVFRRRCERLARLWRDCGQTPVPGSLRYGSQPVESLPQWWQGHVEVARASLGV